MNDFKSAVVGNCQTQGGDCFTTKMKLTKGYMYKYIEAYPGARYSDGSAAIHSECVLIYKIHEDLDDCRASITLGNTSMECKFDVDTVRGEPGEELAGLLETGIPCAGAESGNFWSYFIGGAALCVPLLILCAATGACEDCIGKKRATKSHKLEDEGAQL